MIRRSDRVSIGQILDDMDVAINDGTFMDLPSLVARLRAILFTA